MSDTTQTTHAGQGHLHHINKPRFAITGGFIVAFCLVALSDLDLLSGMVDSSFAFSAKCFGL